MIFLKILGVIILLVSAVLFIPVRVDLKYSEDFEFKVSFLKIPLFKSKEKNQKPDTKTSEKKKKEKTENNATADFKNYFARLKNEDGFVSAVKEIMSLVTEILSHIKGLLRHIKINNVKLNITVGSFDAAKTALDYGAVCQAVYPVTAVLNSVAKIGFKEIGVRADFENGKCDFGFSLAVKMQIFFLILTALRSYLTYKKFITEKVENERKQQH